MKAGGCSESGEEAHHLLMSVGSTFPIHRKPTCFILKKLQSCHYHHVIHYNLLWFLCDLTSVIVSSICFLLEARVLRSSGKSAYRYLLQTAKLLYWIRMWLEGIGCMWIIPLLTPIWSGGIMEEEECTWSVCAGMYPSTSVPQPNVY